MNIRSTTKLALFSLTFTLSICFPTSEKYDIRKHLYKKGFTESINSDSDTFFYKKNRLLIKLQEYNYFIAMNKRTYRLRYMPKERGNSLIMHSKDYIFATNMIERFIRYHSKNSQSPQVKKRVYSLPNNSKEKIDKIFIDPGHGGKDPGASAYGYLEKDLTLKVSKGLQIALKKRLKNKKVFLIRYDDTFVDLEKRCRIANSKLKQNENGIFISIHFNSWLDKNASGFEIYYLSHESNSEASRTKAIIENSSFYDPNNTNNIPAFITILSRFEAIQYQKESKLLADNITFRVYNKIKNYPVNRGVKSELFYVLKGTLMPSVLIETGFISNIKDMEFFNNKKKMRQLVDAVADGLHTYITDFENSGGYTRDFFSF